MHGARAALRDAAAVLGAGQSDVLANRLEQGRAVVDVHVVIFAVDIEAQHSQTSPGEITGASHLTTGKHFGWRKV